MVCRGVVRRTRPIAASVCKQSVVATALVSNCYSPVWVSWRLFRVSAQLRRSGSKSNSGRRMGAGPSYKRHGRRDAGRGPRRIISRITCRRRPSWIARFRESLTRSVTLARPPRNRESRPTMSPGRRFTASAEIAELTKSSTNGSTNDHNVKCNADISK